MLGAVALSVVLSWSDCVRLALDANPDLSAAKSSAASARYTRNAAYNGLLPRASLSNSWRDGSGVSDASDWSASANVSLDLFDLGRIASIRGAAANLSRAEAAQRQTSASVRFRLHKAWAGLLFAQEDVNVARSVLDLREQAAELVSLRYDSGRESKGNMLRTQAQLLEARASVAQSERDLRAAKRELAALLAVEDASVLTATGTFGGAEPVPEPQQLASFAAARPDIAVRQADLRAAEASLAQARADFWPSLSASYSRSVTGGTEFPDGPRSWSAGLTLSLPIFGGGPLGTFYSERASRAGLDRARAELKAARLAALDELETAWSSWAAAADQIRVREALRTAARQRSEEADVRYANGLMTFENWETVVSDRVQTENSVLASLRAVEDAAAGWDLAVGRPLEEP